VGKLIGAQGRHIAPLRQQYGVEFEIPPRQSEEHDDEPVAVIIRGPEEGVRKAAADIRYQFNTKPASSPRDKAVRDGATKAKLRKKYGPQEKRSSDRDKEGGKNQRDNSGDSE
jgi:hypothetical protein